MKLSRRKFMEALAAAGIISVAPPLTASPAQPPPAPGAPPARSPSLASLLPPRDEPFRTNALASASASVSPSEEASVSTSISPSSSWSFSVSPSPEWPGTEDDEPAWPEPYGGSVPIKLDVEEARKALEAMEKLGGLMGDSVDDIIRRVYKDVLK